MNCFMKKRYYVEIILVFLLIFKPAFASEATDLMQKAGTLYQQEKYEQAAQIYQKLADSGYEGTSLYYNLGNAYYKSGKLGLSILYYEKALKLSPNDDDINHNLALANSKIVDKVEPLPKFFLFEWWESILAFFPLSGWTYLVYALYIILLILIGIYFFSRSAKIQKNSLYAGVGSLFLLAIAIALMVVKLNREVSNENAIILEPTAIAKVSPDSNGGDAFVIHEGSKVSIIDNVNNWVEIKLTDGKVGWLNKNNLGVI